MRYLALALWPIDSVDYDAGIRDADHAREIAQAQLDGEADFPDVSAIAVIEGHIDSTNALMIVASTAQTLANNLRRKPSCDVPGCTIHHIN